jgi:hypothetical protein
MYDEKHRYWIINHENGGRVYVAFKGLREYLLCELCERKFRDYETYAHEVIFGRQPLTVEDNQAHPNVPVFHGIRYAEFKLFLFSLLWRMSVAKNDYFSAVSLGSYHEEKLRQMLLTGDPGKPHEYGCILSPVFHNTKVFDAFAVPPEDWRVDGLNGYRFAIRGLAMMPPKIRTVKSA